MCDKGPAFAIAGPVYSDLSLKGRGGRMRVLNLPAGSENAAQYSSGVPSNRDTHQCRAALCAWRCVLDTSTCGEWPE